MMVGVQVDDDSCLRERYIFIDFSRSAGSLNAFFPNPARMRAKELSRVGDG